MCKATSNVFVELLLTHKTSSLLIASVDLSITTVAAFRLQSQLSQTQIAKICHTISDILHHAPFGAICGVDCPHVPLFLLLYAITLVGWLKYLSLSPADSFRVYCECIVIDTVERDC